jgi:hypothetical protein
MKYIILQPMHLKSTLMSITELPLSVQISILKKTTPESIALHQDPLPHKSKPVMGSL